MRSIESIRAPLAELRHSLAARLDCVPASVRADVERAVSRYLDEAESAPPETPSDRLDYLTRYGVAFWRVIARKPRARGTSIGVAPG